MEEDWELLELTGPCSAYAVHSPSDSLVFAIGSIIIVWDIRADKKINIRCHEGPVSGIAFSSDFSYLLTVESSMQPMVSVWKWNSFQQVTVKWLPFKSRKLPPSVLLTLSATTLAVVENETEGGYRLSLWEWRAPDLTLRQAEEIEMRKSCLAVSIFGNNCLTVESQCLKLWQMQNPLTIGKRLHFHSQIVDVRVHPPAGLFLVLLDSGSISAVNSSGKVLTSLSHKSFASIALGQDFLFAGAEDGSLSVVSLKGFHSQRDLPSTHTSSIVKLEVSQNGSAFLIFADSTVQILQVSQGQILNQSSGHAAAVHSVAWTHRWNFVSASDEPCLYNWNYSQQGWAMQAVDVSGGSGIVTAMAVHPSFRVICCGFTRGTVKMFEVDEQTRLIENCQYSNAEVSGLCFAPAGEFLLITYATGQVLLTDHTTNVPLLWLEDHGSPPLGGQFVDSERPVTLHEPFLLQMHCLEMFGQEVQRTHLIGFPLQAECKGFVIHKSGAFMAVSIACGAICIFSLHDAEIVGVIDLDTPPLGCFQDPTGLYIACFLQSADKRYSRLVVFESGTGDKACELSRLDSVERVGAATWSHDGRFLLLGGMKGSLSVWKTPEKIMENIEDVMENMQSNPSFWDQFPINLPNKTVKGVQNQTFVRKELEPISPKKEGAFVDSVISFVKLKQSPKLQRTVPDTSKQNLPDNSKRYNFESSRRNQHENSIKRSNAYEEQPARREGIQDKPVSLSKYSLRQTRRLPNATQLYQRGRTSEQKPNTKYIKSSSQIPTQQVDIHCEEPYSDLPMSSNSEVERAYRDMDRFPY